MAGNAVPFFVCLFVCLFFHIYYTYLDLVVGERNMQNAVPYYTVTALVPTQKEQRCSFEVALLLPCST